MKVGKFGTLVAETNNPGGELLIEVVDSEGTPICEPGRGTHCVAVKTLGKHIVAVRADNPTRRVGVRRLETANGPVFRSELCK